MAEGAGRLAFEREAWRQGRSRVAGVDEAGRGPLAGPVVSAAVVFPPAYIEAEQYGRFAALTDSKQLTALQRDRFYDQLFAVPGIDIGIGFGEASEIDAVNILQATHRSMRRALLHLAARPDFALVDGRPVPSLPCPSRAIVKGDALCLSVSAASVIAKVTRDRWMDEFDRAHPEYGFVRHKGYGTALHIQALLKYGATTQHRRSFRPVRDIESIRSRLTRTEASADVAAP